MKKFKPLSALAVMGLLTALSGNAQQISYAYDSGGNRVSRSIVLGAPTRSTRGGDSPQDSTFFREMNGPTEIRIYPNPVKSVLTVTVRGYELTMAGEISLFSLGGQQLLNLPIREEITQIDMHNFSKGNYVMNIRLNGKSTPWKVIKQ